jgi:hypothetical protein
MILNELYDGIYEGCGCILGLLLGHFYGVTGVNDAWAWEGHLADGRCRFYDNRIDGSHIMNTIVSSTTSNLRSHASVYLRCIYMLI